MIVSLNYKEDVVRAGCVCVVGGCWLRRPPVEKMCNAMVKETRGGLSDSIGRGGGGGSAYVLSTRNHTIMQMWEETGGGLTED